MLQVFHEFAYKLQKWNSTTEIITNNGICLVVETLVTQLFYY